MRESDFDRVRKKALLSEQLRERGYGAAQVLGPFDGRDGAVEYTVTLYTGRALRWQATLRGDYPTLHARIAALPPPE